MRQNRAMQQEYRQMQKQLVVLNGAVASLQEKDRDIYHTIFNADPPIIPRLPKELQIMIMTWIPLRISA